MTYRTCYSYLVFFFNQFDTATEIQRVTDSKIKYEDVSEGKIHPKYSIEVIGEY